MYSLVVLEATVRSQGVSRAGLPLNARRREHVFHACPSLSFWRGPQQSRHARCISSASALVSREYSFARPSCKDHANCVRPHTNPV